MREYLASEHGLQRWRKKIKSNSRKKFLRKLNHCSNRYVSNETQNGTNTRRECRFIAFKNGDKFLLYRSLKMNSRRSREFPNETPPRGGEMDYYSSCMNTNKKKHLNSRYDHCPAQKLAHARSGARRVDRCLRFLSRSRVKAKQRTQRGHRELYDMVNVTTSWPYTGSSLHVSQRRYIAGESHRHATYIRLSSPSPFT